MLAKLLGDRGEQTAARHLKKLGYKILARQYRNAHGEIDLICRHNGVIVFVEVKTRRSTKQGRPEDAVDQRKQRKLTRTALAFLKQENALDNAARFDVVSILWPEDSKEPDIKLYQNAFEPVGNWQMYS
ncbi:MAG: YraN family protein [Planctomycetaceae bacterium]|nr:YraN family protein [Planctomycetaceae bacterium]